MNNIDNSIKVIAIDKATGQKVGEYPSMAKASRSLFIKDAGSKRISSHLRQGNRFNNKLSGLKSYKTGKVYLFEYKID